MMEHKGYSAVVQFDAEANVFHGEVINTRDVITFQGASVEELRREFEASVEDYLAFCRERGEEPEKPYSGQFVTRLDPDLHRLVSMAAQAAGMSLNAWVSEQLGKAVASLGTLGRLFQAGARKAKTAASAGARRTTRVGRTARASGRARPSGQKKPAGGKAQDRGKTHQLA